MLFTFSGYAGFNIANVTKTFRGDSNNLPITVNDNVQSITIRGITTNLPITVNNDFDGSTAR